ncbi:MAG: hypothetical protein JKY22_02305, partial [Flavobacteriaceae bacterium]|nr:hypothetical protein [Flavobacteriaceae bacterium]
MHEEGLLNSGESSGYAFALNNGTYKGLKTVSHGGSLAGYRAQLMRFPEEKFSVIILANRGDANPTSKSFQIADILLKDKFVEESPKKEIKTNTANIVEEFTVNQLTGNYERRAGIVLEITVKNDSLHVVQNWNNSSYNIINTSGNTYEIPNNVSIQFMFSEFKDDYTQSLTVFQNGNENIWKRKEELDLSSLNMEDYTGNYYSEELNITYLLFLEDEKLKLKIANYDAQELNIYETDTFTSDGN